MDGRKLKSELVLHGYSVETLLSLLEEHGIHMTRSTWYRKTRGISEFTRKEIEALTHVLNLDQESMIDIFFKEEVS